MRSLITVTLLFFCSLTYALEFDEFAVVQDTDGFSNVRKTPKLSGEIIGKVNHGQIVWVSGSGDKDWFAVTYFNDKRHEQYGYIHHSRVKGREHFKQFKRKTSKNADVLSFEKGVKKVRFSVESFDKESAEISYTKTSDGGRYISKINGHEIWGTDGGLPKKQYKEIEVTDRTNTSTLPAEALQGLYQPSFYPGNTNVFTDPESGTIYITAFNSDGAGGYVVAFRIVNGTYKNRLVLAPF